MSVVILTRCQCGNWKAAKSKQCRSCYAMYKKLTASREVYYERNHDTCPECGGTKTKSAKLCWSCYRKSLPKPDTICPKCGGEKHPKAKKCLVCHYKYDDCTGHLNTPEVIAKRTRKRAEKHVSDRFYGSGSCGSKKVHTGRSVY